MGVWSEGGGGRVGGDQGGCERRIEVFFLGGSGGEGVRLGCRVGGRCNPKHSMYLKIKINFLTESGLEPTTSGFEIH